MKNNTLIQPTESNHVVCLSSEKSVTCAHWSVDFIDLALHDASALSSQTCIALQ